MLCYILLRWSEEQRGGWDINTPLMTWGKKRQVMLDRDNELPLKPI